MENYINRIDPMILINSLKTPLNISDEIRFQQEKANSPFANDTGSDYDLRGFYKQYGSLQPTSTNGHLTDEYKLPNHKTFSTDSNLARDYKGLREMAINPEGHRYVEDIQNINENIDPYHSQPESIMRFNPYVQILDNGLITPNDQNLIAVNNSPRVEQILNNLSTGVNKLQDKLDPVINKTQTPKNPELEKFINSQPNLNTYNSPARLPNE